MPDRHYKTETQTVLHRIRGWKELSHRIPFTQKLTPTTDRQDFLTLKSFHTAKETINPVIKAPTKQGVFTS